MRGYNARESKTHVHLDVIEIFTYIFQSHHEVIILLHSTDPQHHFPSHIVKRKIYFINRHKLQFKIGNILSKLLLLRGPLELCY